MTDRLFKLGSFESELMDGMESQLSLTKEDKKVASAAQAIDYLNSAASLFDQAGRHKEAEILTTLIEKFAEGSDEIGKLIEESLPKKRTIEEMIQEEIDREEEVNRNRQEVEEIMYRGKKPKFELSDMVDPSNPLADLLKKKTLASNVSPDAMIKNLLENGTVFNSSMYSGKNTEDLLNADVGDDIEIGDLDSEMDFEDEV